MLTCYGGLPFSPSVQRWEVGKTRLRPPSFSPSATSVAYNVLADFGWGSTNVALAAAAFGEGGVRVWPSTAAVLGLRGAVDILFVQLGPRVVVSLESEFEVALWMLFGLGQF